MSPSAVADHGLCIPVVRPVQVRGLLLPQYTLATDRGHGRVHLHGARVFCRQYVAVALQRYVAWIWIGKSFGLVGWWSTVGGDRCDPAVVLRDVIGRVHGVIRPLGGIDHLHCVAAILVVRVGTKPYCLPRPHFEPWLFKDDSACGLDLFP
ncbi:hypothetical protein N7476_004844 [Penicillium atrosanguineum]|uniref:Uncharacterized protein n=1 Tax=Penicillium atrosanguineum TaxID=1132637 RepID=A0A9W9PYA6_9EURO|nr:hypothetical protein N7526_001855 [Penicillium atrosanguineum]KAJ5318424.1 hypothetical protein N7476_004844 [Penicillium atrosanguineum]